MTTTELDKTLLQIIDEAQTREDHWKARALKAEREIEHLRHTIAVMHNQSQA